MRRTLRTILLLSTLLMLAAPAISVQADVAPPQYPPDKGTGIEPDRDTKVQMVSEEVVFDMPAANDPDTTIYLEMTASFQMRNQGSESETMQVGFPMGCDPVDNNASVTVNELPVEILIEDGEAVIIQDVGGQCQSNDWIRFDVTFPPEEDVWIDVKLSFLEQSVGSYFFHHYILETGAGWYGPIGKGAVVFNLPYQPENLNFQGFWDSSTNLSRVYSDKSVRFTFNNLEPTGKNNLYFLIGDPYTWQQVDTARESVGENSQAPKAYVQIGQAYENAMWYDRKIDPVVTILALEAYKHALQLDPYTVEAHVGIASVIFTDQDHATHSEIDLDTDPIKIVLDHLAKAIAIDPNNNDAQNLLQILDCFGPVYAKLPKVDPAWLPTSAPATQTFTPTYTLTPSITPTPTIYLSKTPRPSKSPYYTLTPGPKLSTSTPVSVMTATPIAPQQSTVQSRAVIYLVVIVIMSAAGYVMWRRDQGK